jgi:hypothetical protein
VTRIVTNNLLQPTKRVITNWKNDFMTSDGPNLSAKINLGDIGIPYDSHYRTRIVLPAGENDYLLNYGILEYATFLLIKVTYNGNYDDAMEDDYDPYYRWEPNQDYNIQYYYEGNSGATKPIGRLLLLSGSYLNKLTKIYLNNPLDYDVVLDILHADVEETKSIPISSAITISNLYFSSIITNKVDCDVTIGVTGSTAFFIYEIEPMTPSGYTLNEYYVPFNSILSIVKDSTNIYLNTIKYTLILKFLTDFDCDQSYSRMLFVFTSVDCVYLTENNIYINGGLIPDLSGVGYDMIPPIIYYNSPISGTSWIGSGTTVPVNVYLHLYHDNIKGWTLDSLRLLFISDVTDTIDGNIPLNSIIFILNKNASSVPMTEIIDNGIYDIYISVTDNANNNTTHNISNIVVDDAPPVIVYKNYVISNLLTGNTSLFSDASSAITSGIYITSGFTFNLSGFSEYIISELDIINSVVEYAYDIVDTNTNKYMIDVIIAGWSHNSGGTIIYTGITQPGEYLIEMMLSDKSDNLIVNYFMMMVVWNVSVYSEGYWQDNKVWIDSTLWVDHLNI